MKLTQLALGQAAIKPFSFTRSTPSGPVEIKTAIRVLLDDVNEDAKVRARNRVREAVKQHVALEDAELLDDAQTVEVLAEALRDPDDPTQPWASADDLRALLTPDELRLLARAVDAHRWDVNPSIKDMTPEQFDAVVDAVRQEGSRDPFVYFEPDVLCSFTRILASRLATSPMDRSSIGLGSSPNGGTSNSEKSDDATTSDPSEITISGRCYVLRAVEAD